MINVSTNRSFLRATLPVLAALILGACDSGGGSGTVPLDAGGARVGAGATGAGAPGEAPVLLPDFSVVDMATSATTDGDFGVTATIANGGEGPGTVPAGWFLVSRDAAFTTDYHWVPVELSPQGVGEDGVLEPGETGVFRVTSGFASTEVNFALSSYGEHFGRLWLNPDLSARFVNPENEVTESHAVAELDYENNLGPLASFERVAASTGFQGCDIDAYENNDSLLEATPITTGIRYDFNGCDDLTEVMVIDLVENARYELHRHREGTSGSWRFTVIDPDGRYLARDVEPGNLIVAETSGLHHLVATYRIPILGYELAMEVMQR